MQSQRQPNKFPLQQVLFFEKIQQCDAKPSVFFLMCSSCSVGTLSPHAGRRVLVGDGSQGCCMRLDVIAASLGHVRPPADKTKDSASCLGAKSVVF